MLSLTYGIMVFGAVAASAVEQSLVGLWWQATGITQRGGHDMYDRDERGVNRKYSPQAQTGSNRVPPLD